MPAINLTSFKGEMPIIDAKKLPLGQAVIARNCDLSSGSLEAVKGVGAAVHAFTGPESETLTRYPYGKAFMNFGDDVDMVRGPLSNDSWDRVYWTDGLQPKYSTSEQADSSSLDLGVPAPTSGPVMGSVTGTADDGAIEIDCAYIVTYVSKYGEEGPPSSPSVVIPRKDGQTQSVGSLPGQPSGNFNIAKIRIYRTESGGTFNHVIDLTVGASEFADNIKSDELGIDCPSVDWLSPDSRMMGLTYLGNGILAGFFENTLCFCEPYYPHAWPIGYQLAFKDDIVGVGVSGSGLVVATKQEPWLIYGSHPANMNQQMTDTPYACVSKRSMVDMGAYVLYASSDGLVAAAGGESKLVSSGIISSSDFKALNPETWKAFRYDDRYFVIHDTGCLTFSPSEGLKHFDVAAKAAFFDPEESELYLLLADKTVVKWADGENLIVIWRSGILTLPPRVPFTCARIDQEGDCTLRLYYDGELKVDTEIAGSNMFRLPAGVFREVQIELETTGTIHSVSLGQSGRELI